MVLPDSKLLKKKKESNVSAGAAQERERGVLHLLLGPVATSQMDVPGYMSLTN